MSHLLKEHPVLADTHAECTDGPVYVAMLATCPSGTVLNMASLSHLQKASK